MKTGVTFAGLASVLIISLHRFARIGKTMAGRHLGILAILTQIKTAEMCRIGQARPEETGCNDENSESHK